MAYGEKNYNGESASCARAGTFDRKLAESDRVEYSVEEAESKDLKHLVENSCISCNRLLKSGEIKVVPPRYIQERDQYVRSGAVDRRLMCVLCYNALKTVTQNRAKYKDTATARKSFLVRSVINNLLLKN